jgi:hypothetical protein
MLEKLEQTNFKEDREQLIKRCSVYGKRGEITSKYEICYFEGIVYSCAYVNAQGIHEVQ